MKRNFCLVSNVVGKIFNVIFCIIAINKRLTRL